MERRISLESGCLNSKNDSTLQTDFQPEIEVKVEPDQDDSSVFEVNELEPFPNSRGDLKVEKLDHGLPTLPVGLMPPVEQEEDLENSAYTNTSNDNPNRRTDSSSKRKKCTDQKTTERKKGPNVPIHTIRCSTEQSKLTERIMSTKMNSAFSSEGIKCLLVQGKSTQHPKKPGKRRTSDKLHREERFLCETCGKEFQRSDLLTDHVKIHRRQKPYACDQCDMKFAKPSYLKIHLRRHAGDRPHSCDQCDKKFFDMYDLRVHQRDHTGERPYVCSECGKGFKRIYILNKHKLTHSKERPFQCSVCGKEYRYGYSYRLHMKDHLDLGS